MKLGHPHKKINWQNGLAFLLLCLVLGESHEVAHFLVGKVICGCWPASRDFNAWSLCPDCENLNPHGFWATAAGPIFSMTLAWVGMFMLSGTDAARRSLGFMLIWANVPQARIMTILMRGGDEWVVLRHLTKGTMLESWSYWITLAIVIAMAFPPIVASFRLAGWKQSLGFMFIPFAVLIVYGFMFLNRLLEGGFLSQVWIMGTPLFITLHTLLALTALVLMRRHLFTLYKA